MSVTIPSLDPVTDILDTDKIMVTQQSGQTFTIDGASFNKRNQAVIASSTTLTGAPLKTGNIVRVYFTADITGVNTSTALSLSYNGSSKTVKVPKDGALVNFTAQNMGGSPTVYKYLQAYTTLELLYDGTNFVIIGNPVVISSSDYTIYADGTTKQITRYPYLSSLSSSYVRTNVFFKETNSITFYMVNASTEGLPTISDASNTSRFGTVMFSNANNNLGQCSALLILSYYKNNNTEVGVKVYAGFYLFTGVTTLFSNWKEL